MENKRREEPFVIEYDSSRLERGYEYREHFLQKLGDKYRVMWKKEKRLTNGKDITIIKKQDFKSILIAIRFIDKRTGKNYVKYGGMAGL